VNVFYPREQFLSDDDQPESAKLEQEKAQRERIEKLVTALHFIKLEPYIAGNTKGPRPSLSPAPCSQRVTCLTQSQSPATYTQSGSRSWSRTSRKSWRCPAALRFSFTSAIFIYRYASTSLDL
jgi:hypothetical protein